MKPPIRHFSALALAMIFAARGAASLSAGETGVVQGRVPLSGATVPIALEKYAGKISGRVESPPRPVAGVWLEKPGLRAGSAHKEVALEQRGYQFATGLLIVPVGTKVTFPNSDPDYHNVFSLSKTRRFDLGRYKTDERPAPVVTFDQPGVVRLACEIHEHMRSAVIVVDSPYFARTTEDGRFTISGVAPGNYTLKVWADEKRTWEQPVTITAGRTLEVSFPAK